ncbi:CBN-FBXB-72 protein [Caenorhabditis brenneri]|uniref:CBN-FBXB-72 protein n=1 Tax=Caenorhabditis brenneri TaxID=135651 RepID=G0PFE0_CAEBE|nr:CBN-FBXB-72 protein [Caenorhabditis brenneri]
MEIYRFPLFRLQQNNCIRVLRNMNFLEQLSFSVISKRSKNLVKSLKLVRICLYLRLRENLTLAISSYKTTMRLSFERDNFQPEPIGQIYNPNCDYIKIRIRKRRGEPRESYTWRKEEFRRIRDWIDHFRDVFNRSKFSHLEWIYDFYDPHSIHDIIKGLQSVIARECPLKYYKRIYAAFKETNRLNLYLCNQRNLTPMHDLIIGNYDFFRPPDVIQNNYKLSLNDLLVSNSREILGHSPIKEKFLNKFLKLWRRGSNPRLQHFYVYLRPNVVFNIENVLRGIDHQESPESRRREFRIRQFNELEISYLTVRSGIDIHRFDGIHCTVNYIQEIRMFDMFVWN